MLEILNKKNIDNLTIIQIMQKGKCMYLLHCNGSTDYGYFTLLYYIDINTEVASPIK